MRSGRRRTPWFSFLVHPRDDEDLLRSPGGRLLRDHSRDTADFRSKFDGGPPVVVAEIHFAFQGAWGELIAVQRRPETMLDGDAAAAVGVALGVATQRGARVIGLGGLTSPATGGGQRLLPLLPAGVTLTNGNAYTAAVVCHNVVEASEVLGLGQRARVAVVGCTGSVGVAASRLLADRGFPLLLVGRTARRAEALLGDLAPGARFAGDLERLGECDVVVLLTADPAARLRPGTLRPGTVVVDCAQPVNVTPEDLPALTEQGVMVTEGGLVTIPGYTCGFDFRHAAPGTAFACLAETYLFCREGLREPSVGRPSVETARRLDRLAERRGIVPHPLHLKNGEPLAGDESPLPAQAGAA